MKNTYNTKRYTRPDNCPACGPISICCCEYSHNNEIYLYEEQCPKCHDFWQVALDEQGSHSFNKGEKPCVH